MSLINSTRAITFCLLQTAALLLAVSMNAQTTQFTYQGKLSDASSPANGSYDFQFKLFDALSGGAQQGGV